MAEAVKFIAGASFCTFALTFAVDEEFGFGE